GRRPGDAGEGGRIPGPRKRLAPAGARRRPHHADGPPPGPGGRHRGRRGAGVRRRLDRRVHRPGQGVRGRQRELRRRRGPRGGPRRGRARRGGPPLMAGAEAGRRGPSRRHLLLGGAAAGLGAAGMVGAGALLGGPAPPAQDGPEPHGARTVPFHGEHQAGVETPPQAFASFLAFDLDRGTGAEGVRRLLLLLTDDAAGLTRGEGALADSEPELAAAPARLTVTFGFGPGLVERVAPDAAPEWLRPLPRFTEDRLRDEWSGGDLLLQVCADDPLAVAHAARMLTKDTRAFAGLRWVQDGFRNARGALPEGTTMRNLMGQVDGTVNPAPGTGDFDRLVW